ncbi:hypothetical protein AHiyo8_02730 [Arthrobacter sp. Hiyo8]|nr:hypothetical protein AHiyo8_02730 [Arthrobacter sp. Hiyo8]
MPKEHQIRGVGAELTARVLVAFYYLPIQFQQPPFNVSCEPLRLFLVKPVP